MHWNGLSGVYLGFKACQIQCHRFRVSAISGSWKITISGKNFTFVDFDWEKCIKIAWVVHIEGFKACQIQWHLLQVSMISRFMKNHNFRRHSRKWGSKPWKWDGTYAAVLLGSHFTPTPCCRTLYLDLPIKMQKNHNNSKSTCHTKF